MPAALLFSLLLLFVALACALGLHHLENKCRVLDVLKELLGLLDVKVFGLDVGAIRYTCYSLIAKEAKEALVLCFTVVCPDVSETDEALELLG